MGILYGFSAIRDPNTTKVRVANPRNTGKIRTRPRKALDRKYWTAAPIPNISMLLIDFHTRTPRKLRHRDNPNQVIAFKTIIRLYGNSATTSSSFCSLFSTMDLDIAGTMKKFMMDARHRATVRIATSKIITTFKKR